ncbi:MAG: hypothetical protein KC636_25910 [Myxococcales bacterium]|nr:hypothetical protein [Myxococcales bacterium]
MSRRQRTKRPRPRAPKFRFVLYDARAAFDVEAARVLVVADTRAEMREYLDDYNDDAIPFMYDVVRDELRNGVRLDRETLHPEHEDGPTRTAEGGRRCRHCGASWSGLEGDAGCPDCGGECRSRRDPVSAQETIHYALGRGR